MNEWQLLVIAGVVFIIIEIFTPVLFFLNLALACFMTAVLAYYVFNWNILVPVFVVFSAIFLLFLRPLLVKTRLNGQKTGVDEKYIGKVAKVTETVTETGGLVSIYDERWNARSNTGEEIPVGAEVKIVRNDSLVLYVEKEA
jgi:membrane protein implicated in regulation of membrane protease activity